MLQRKEMSAVRTTKEITSGTKGSTRSRVDSGVKSMVKAAGMSISAHRVRNMGSRKSTAPMKGSAHK